jgi:LGFP repeat
VTLYPEIFVMSKNRALMLFSASLIVTSTYFFVINIVYAQNFSNYTNIGSLPPSVNTTLSNISSSFSSIEEVLYEQECWDSGHIPSQIEKARCDINNKLEEMRANGFSDVPLSDDVIASVDGIGYFRHFEGGLSIYWSPETRAHEVHGGIGTLYRQSGGELSCLGYPVTDEKMTLDGVGRYNYFKNGYTYWAPSAGAESICSPYQLPNPTPMIDEQRARSLGCTFIPIRPAWTPIIGVGTGQEVALGKVRQAYPAYEDFPTVHHSHDMLFDVELLQNYNGLLSTRHKTTSDGTPILHNEWEMGTRNDGRTDRFPLQFWPEEGDWVWMMGRWVFDCAHRPYSTEFHPVSGVAFTRPEPTILQGDTAPSFTWKTYIYIHGKGGYFDTPVPVKRITNPYVFNLFLPVPCTRNGFLCIPSSTAELRAEVNTIFAGDRVNPIIIPSPVPQFAGPVAIQPVHIVYPFKSIDPSTENKFGSILSLGWREPVLTSGYRLLNVTFDSIKINNAHDLDRAEWDRLWASVNGHWIELSGPSNNFGLGSITDNEERTFTGRSIILLVPEDGNIRVHSAGWERDAMDLVFGRGIIIALPFLADNNDPIGIVNKVYPVSSPNLLVPKDELSMPHPEEPNTAGDYNLRFHIEELERYPVGMSVR